MLGYQYNAPEIMLFQDKAQAHTELYIVAGAYNHKPNHFLEMWTFHIEATLYSTTNCKTQHCLTTQFITSPQEQKTNNFHQIDLDANGVLTHGGK